MLPILITTMVIYSWHTLLLQNKNKLSIAAYIINIMKSLKGRRKNSGENCIKRNFIIHRTTIHQILLITSSQRTRMEGNKNTRIILIIKHTGNGPLGTSRCKLEDSTKLYIKVIQYEDGNYIHLIYDRNH